MMAKTDQIMLMDLAIGPHITVLALMALHITAMDLMKAMNDLLVLLDTVLDLHILALDLIMKKIDLKALHITSKNDFLALLDIVIGLHITVLHLMTAKEDTMDLLDLAMSERKEAIAIMARIVVHLAPGTDALTNQRLMKNLVTKLDGRIDLGITRIRSRIAKLF